MKPPKQNWITAGAVAVAIASGSLAWTSSKREKQAIAENLHLRRQLAELGDAEPSAALPEPTHKNSTPAEESDDLVVLQSMLEDTESETGETKETYAERMARMAEENPERYAKRIEKLAAQQQKLKYNTAERAALFMDLDTSRMTDKELEVHNLLVDQMGEIWGLMEQLESPELSDNRELLQEISDGMRQSRKLLKRERNTMFKLLADDLGYDQRGAKEFTDHINAIIEFTTFQQPTNTKKGRKRSKK